MLLRQSQAANIAHLSVNNPNNLNNPPNNNPNYPKTPKTPRYKTSNPGGSADSPEKAVQSGEGRLVNESDLIDLWETTSLIVENVRKTLILNPNNPNSEQP